MKVRAVMCDGYRLRVTTWGSGSPHAIELPGFGLRPALQVRDAKFSNLARYVAHVADELGVDRALLVGHSLGGGVSLHLALERPDMVDGLVLLAPAALGRSLHWIYKLYCLPLIGRALLRPHGRITKPYVRHFLVGSARRADDHFLSMLVRH